MVMLDVISTRKSFVFKKVDPGMLDDEQVKAAGGLSSMGGIEDAYIEDGTGILF
jgi:hypothetical protein